MCEKNTPENAGKSNGKALACPTNEYTFYNGIAEIGGQHFGFTKREVIAKDLMAAMITKPSNVEKWATYAASAVRAADILLAELAKPQGS